MDFMKDDGWENGDGRPLRVEVKDMEMIVRV